MDAKGVGRMQADSPGDLYRAPEQTSLFTSADPRSASHKLNID